MFENRIHIKQELFLEYSIIDLMTSVDHLTHIHIRLRKVDFQP